MNEARWHRLGPVGQFVDKPLQQIQIGDLTLALSYRDGEFGAISGNCNHIGGPLGDGTLSEDGYAVCPWHSWQFHRLTGEARPGIPAAVPRYEVKVENGEIFVNLTPATDRVNAPHPAHPLEREIRREPGPLRVVGISTTAMNETFPRYSTSEDLLQVALEYATSQGAATKLIRLNDLAFKNCEGYYSKSARACTWPCTITQMDQTDELNEVYEALVFWADVALIATSIRWGAPSSLYFKMVERMNCIQNQITVQNRVLIRNKVAGFVITGGQDNIQAVAGQMMMFFGELGFNLPQFPFVAHSRGWSAEDMENNVARVKSDQELRDGAKALTGRCLKLAAGLVACDEDTSTIERGGREVHMPK
jgi:nitrite reductase/ring-hydroxylating ferredoxin subunit/multimeric flavodoxin WrbA